MLKKTVHLVFLVKPNLLIW